MEITIRISLVVGNKILYGWLSFIDKAKNPTRKRLCAFWWALVRVMAGPTIHALSSYFICGLHFGHGSCADKSHPKASTWAKDLIYSLELYLKCNLQAH